MNCSYLSRRVILLRQNRACWSSTVQSSYLAAHDLRHVSRRGSHCTSSNRTNLTKKRYALAHTAQSCRSPATALRHFRRYHTNLAKSATVAFGSDGTSILETQRHQKQQMDATREFVGAGYQFLYSAATLKDHPRNQWVPELVLLGASNVGKSTFINGLTGRPDAARVSQRPGKTTLMNAYGVGPVPDIAPDLLPRGTRPPRHGLVLVDTPGYGYRSQSGWGDSLLHFIEHRTALRGAVVLLSSEKKGLLEHDKWLLQTLATFGTRTLIVLTKADKCGTDWFTKCGRFAHEIREYSDRLRGSSGQSTSRDSAADAPVYITSATALPSAGLSDNGGFGAVRSAMLEMAGLSTQGPTIGKQPENAKWSGQVVPFDDVHWNI